MLLVHYLEVLPEISDKISNKEKKQINRKFFVVIKRYISNADCTIKVRNEWIEQDA